MGYAQLVRSHLHILTAGLLSLALALYQLYPAWLEPTNIVPGNWNHPDCLSNHWLMIWVAEQMLSGESIGLNDRYYWPVGDQPVLAGNGSEGIAYYPFHALLGWPIGLTYYALMVLTLNGLGGYALARAAGAERWSALVTIGVTGMAPFTIQELSSGRFSQVSIFWMLFTLSSWIHLLNRPGLRRAGWTGLLGAATCLFYWYYGFFTIGAALILLLGHRWRSGALSSRAWRMIWTSALGGMAVLSPWAIWFFMGWSEIPGTSEVSVFPHPQALKDALSPGVPFLVGEGRHAGQAMPASIWALGLVGCSLACWTAYRRQQSMVGIRHALGLAAVAVIFWLLALGPVVSWAPYNLLYGLAPPLRRFWWPVRHVILANAAWGVLAALALSSILGRLEGKWRQFLRPSIGLSVVFSVVPLLQFQGAPTKVQLMSVDLNGYLLSPLADMEDGVLMEPPISPEVAGSQQHLMYQWVHHKPLMSGHALWVDRVRPDAWDEFVGENSWLTALQEMERGELQGSLQFDGDDIRLLDEQGLRWIALNPEYFTFPMKTLRTRYREVLEACFGPAVIKNPRGPWLYDIRNYSGIEDIPLEEWTWPDDVLIGDEDLPMHGRRPKSTVFSDYP